MMRAADEAAWPAAILFDLDGTLIHSSPDIAAAINEVMLGEGLAPFDLGEVEAMIGHGIRKLVERAFAARSIALTESELDQRHRVMMAIYARGLTTLTRLNPGAREALEFCRENGIRTAVVTNKPETMTRAILAHFDLAPMVDVVIGGDSGVPRKPAPDMLLEACRRLDVTPQHTIMVGDGAADTDAARAANIPSVLVEGGYAGRPASELGGDFVANGLIYLTLAVQNLRGRV